jgi:hypothetical protein
MFANLAHALLGGILAPLSRVEFDRKKDILNKSFEPFFAEIAKGFWLSGRTRSSRIISACLRLILFFGLSVFVVCLPGA